MAVIITRPKSKRAASIPPLTGTAQLDPNQQMSQEMANSTVRTIQLIRRADLVATRRDGNGAVALRKGLTAPA
jgi:hypothetical protein